MESRSSKNGVELNSSLSKAVLVFVFVMIYSVSAYLGWPTLQLSGLRILEFVDLTAIIQSGNLCSGKLGFWGFLDLSQPLPENCGGFIYGRPLLALLATVSIPLTWTVPVAILLGLATVVMIALLIGVNLGSSKAKLAIAAAAVFSPGVFLLFERANFDLLMAMGVMVGGYLLSRGRFFSGLLIIGLTSVLKYYTVPLLIVAPFLFGKGPKQIGLGSAISLAISIYAAWDYSQLPRVPGFGYAQFGSAVLPHYFAHMGLEVSNLFSIGFGIVMPLLLGLLVFRYSKQQGNTLILGSWFRFNNLSNSLAFISLSTVFVSCFFAGLNFDYRLVFLAVPGVILLQSANGERVKLYLLNSSLLVALWGSAALGNGVDFGSDQLRFIVVGLLQLAGDTMVFVWIGLLLGLVARIFMGSYFFKKLELKGAN
jgi:hypothetical protein